MNKWCVISVDAELVNVLAASRFAWQVRSPLRRVEACVKNDTASLVYISLHLFHQGFPVMSSTPDPTKIFSEKLNGRVAMLGLAIGLATEWITGQGIIQQVFGIFG